MVLMKNQFVISFQIGKAKIIYYSLIIDLLFNVIVADVGKFCIVAI